jgi:hypothetical protein
MSAPVLPAEFVINADWRDYEQPLASQVDSTLPNVGLPSAFVDFIPRLPAGFEAFVENYQVVPPQNATWQLTVSGIPNAGTFTLTYGGQTTTALAYNATATQIQTALQALSSIGAGNVAVTAITDDDGDVLAGEFQVEFQGTFVGQNLTGLTTNGASLVATPAAVVVTTEQPGLTPVNCIQTISLTDVIGGSFTLSFRDFVTPFLAWNATAAQVQTALQGLNSIGPGNAVVEGSAGGPYTVLFQGDLAGDILPLISAGSEQLQGNIPTVIANTTPGVAPASCVQLITLLGSPTAGTFTLTYGGHTTGALAFNATSTQVQTALQALASIGSGNVTVAGNPGGPFTVTFQGAMSNESVPLITATSSLIDWLFLATQVEVQMQIAGTPGVDAVQTLTFSEVVGGTYTLSYGGVTTTPLAWNASAATIQAALIALSTIGSGQVAVAGTNPFTVTFGGTLGFQPVFTLAINSTGLTANVPEVTAVMTQPGVVEANCIQQVVVNYAVAGEFTLSYGEQTTIELAYNASTSEVQEALEALTGIGVNNIDVTSAETGEGFVIEFVAVLASQPITQLTADGSLLTAQEAGTGLIVTNVGAPAVGRDAGIPLKPITARIYEGQLQTIDLDDDAGVTLVANDPVLNLAAQGFEDLYYDVRFRDVQIAGVVDNLTNFAIMAPATATSITLTDPALTRYPYAPLYNWASPYGTAT